MLAQIFEAHSFLESLDLKSTPSRRFTSVLWGKDSYGPCTPCLYALIEENVD